MSELPIGVGSRESQAVFLRENEEFTREHPRLHDLSTRIFIRGLPLPDEQEWSSMISAKSSCSAETGRPQAKGAHRARR